MSPPLILKQKELGGYNATGDSLCLGHPVWHAPGELARDPAGSMSLGTSMLRGSHLGSNHHTGDEGICIGDHHQGSWLSQQLLCTPQPRIPPFISKPKEIGGCIDGGHDSAAGPNSSRDNDGSAPCSPHNHSIGNNSMTYVEWDPECKCAIPSVLPSFCNPWTMFNNYILLHLPASDNLDSILHAYECDHGFMSFNVIEELQEVDGKSLLSIGECYEYNHSKRKDCILRYTIIANTDKAQCMV
jgi:hypothetical protein